MNQPTQVEETKMVSQLEKLYQFLDADPMVDSVHKVTERTIDITLPVLEIAKNLPPKVTEIGAFVSNLQKVAKENNLENFNVSKVTFKEDNRGEAMVTFLLLAK